MFNPIIVLLFCYINCALASDPQEITNLSILPFLKKNNSYVRVVDKENHELPINDYVPTVGKLLDDVKSGVAISADDLNKFSDGVSQYYLSRAYEYYYSDLRPVVSIVNVSEPVCLPNVTAEGTPEILFYDVKVYGFPPFKPNYKVISELNSNPYFQNFEVLFKAPSDTVLFTGSFCVYQKSYFFVYVTSTNSYHSKHLKVRNKVGIVKSKTTEDSFSFLTEHLYHSYDSFLDHYTEVNDSIFPKFITAMEKVYLPTLAVSADSIITPKFSSSSTKFSELHRQKILDLLVQAAVQYGTLKGFNVFHVRPMYFTNIPAASRNRTAVITYDNITVEGLMNFEKYEFSTPTRTANNSVLNLSDKITFTYADSGDKAASMSFVIQLRLKDTVKKYKIKSMVIETAFVADMTKFPPVLSRNTEAFEMSTGFMVDFEVDTEDDPYYFIAKHASSDLTRAIDSLVFGTKYAD